MTPEERVLDEIAMVIDQHVLKMLGVVKKACRKSPEAQRDHITVLPRAIHKKAKHIATKIRQIP